MTGMNDLFPPGEAVRKELLRRHLMGPVANVQGFGAKGDGAADDTRAIQAAIDHVVGQGGGTVYVPAGVYRIMPQRDPALGPEVDALRIRGDNVRITGDGPAVTRLVFRVAGNRDPSDSFDIVYRDGHATAWRGSAIAIEGTTTIDQPRHDIVIENLEIDGGAYPGNTGDRMRPVAPETGAGWDVTHRGIRLVGDRAYRRLRFADLYLHNFRGEIVHGSGGAIDDVVVERCDIHSTNGDGIALAATQEVRDTRVHDCAHACIENLHPGKPGRYVNNRLYDARIGVSIQGPWDAAAPTVISGNTFTECRNAAVLLNLESGPTFIVDNSIVDCGYEQQADAAIAIGPGKDGARVISGVTVRNNTILRQNRAGGIGIALGCEEGARLRSLVVSDNFIGSSGPAVEKNLRFAAPLAYTFHPRAEVSGIFVSGNTYFRTQRAAQNPGGHGAIPLMWDNRAIETGESAVMVTDGRTPVRVPSDEVLALAAPSDGAIVTPALAPADYSPGQTLTLTGGNAQRRIYIPQSSDLYECREGRFLSPGVLLTLRCDGKKFYEVDFVDRRARHYAEVLDGAVLDADGHPTVYISVPTERRFSEFTGIGHGAQVRVIATNNNVTIVHSEAIQLQAGTDYQMVANEVKMFFRARDGVLREM
ncbi:MAG: glycosyl hydrolase family 28-related protein [Gemmatimonas sp.]